MNAFVKWLHKPAKPWQFWLPQSGAMGGLINGVVISSVLLAVIYMVTA